MHLAAGDAPVGLARRVASSPRRRLLGADGLRLLDAIADGLADDDPEGRRLRLELAQLATEVGEHDSARRRWAALVDDLETPDERVRAALEAARLSFHFGGLDEIRASMERLRSLGRPEPWVGVAVDALEAAVVGVAGASRGGGSGARARDARRRAPARGAERRDRDGSTRRSDGRTSPRSGSPTRPPRRPSTWESLDRVGRGGDHGGPRPRGGPDRSARDARARGSDERPLRTCSGRLSNGRGTTRAERCCRARRSRPATGPLGRCSTSVESTRPPRWPARSHNSLNASATCRCCEVSPTWFATRSSCSAATGAQPCPGSSPKPRDSIPTTP